MSAVIDAIAQGYRDSLSAVPYRGGELVSLPAAFTSGTLVTVHVVISQDTVTVTDRGLTADELCDAGLDLQTTRVARSFAAVRDSTGLPPAFGSEDWEITASADIGDIAIAIQSVADAAIRADGLRVLSTVKRRMTFADRALRKFLDRAAVVPHPKMPGKYGSNRQVTLSYGGKDELPYYVQALSGGDNEARVRSYDHASGLFLGATPDMSHRVALLQQGAWEAWQVRNLGEVCRVIEEQDADEFIAATAA